MASFGAAGASLAVDVVDDGRRKWDSHWDGDGEAAAQRAEVRRVGAEEEVAPSAQDVGRGCGHFLAEAYDERRSRGVDVENVVSQGVDDDVGRAVHLKNGLGEGHAEQGVPEVKRRISPGRRRERDEVDLHSVEDFEENGEEARSQFQILAAPQVGPDHEGVHVDGGTPARVAHGPLDDLDDGDADDSEGRFFEDDGSEVREGFLAVDGVVEYVLGGLGVR